MKGRVLLIMFTLLFSCAKNEEENPIKNIPHHTYEEISDRVIAWSNVFMYNEKYGVYFYSRTCAYCDSIKDEVIDIALTCSLPIYFCNDNAIESDYNVVPKETIGESEISQFKIKGFPSLIVVEEHKIKNHEAGRSDTINFLRNIE